MITYFPPIESTRLRFVELSEKYAKQIFEYASDPEVTKYVVWDTHHSIDDTMDFLKWSEIQNNMLYHFDFGLVTKDNDEFIGTIGTSHYSESEKSIDFGYVLNKKYWVKGYATESVIAICECIFQLDGIESLCAYVFEGNTASRKVLEKCSFKYCRQADCLSLSKPNKRITMRYELRKSDYLATND